MVTARQKLQGAIPLADPLRKQMLVAGIICRLFREAGARAVVVGGSAVEFYTAAQYTTKDVDFITAQPNRIKAVMDELGFVNRGGTWILPEDPTIVVEFPAGPLAGSYDKVRRVRVQGDDIADVIGIEDIIVDRMSANKHWRDGSASQARYMAVSRYDEIDWMYCLEAAGAVDCVAEVARLRDWSRRQRKKARDLALGDAQK
jgi:hypothetical protein